jgi:hypothetical protein
MIQKKIINPQNVADRLNSVFVDCAEDLPAQYKPSINGHTPQMKIEYNSNSVIVHPVREDKLNHVVYNFKGKASTGFIQIDPRIFSQKMYSVH